MNLWQLHRWTILAFLCILTVAQSGYAANFFVSRADVDDELEEGTLRWALVEASRLEEFNVITISESLTINVNFGFPVGGFPSGLTIEGNGATLTTTDGAAAFGFRVEQSNVTIRGLVIGGFSENGIEIAASNCTVEACIITNNGESGIFIAETLGAPADNCVVGGLADEDGNIIGGNGQTSTTRGHGIRLLRANGTRIYNNLIGASPPDSILPTEGNAGRGVYVEDSADTTIGDTVSDSGAGNVITGNLGGGIFLTGAATTNTSIFSNHIGIAEDGVTALPNNGGISTTANDVQEGVTIGRPDARNIISGNAGTGIALDSVTNAVIQGNYWFDL